MNGVKQTDVRFSVGSGDSYVSARADYVLSKFFIHNDLDVLEIPLERLNGLIEVLTCIKRGGVDKETIVVDGEIVN